MKIQVENAQQNGQVDWTKNPQLVCCGSNVILVHANQEDKINTGYFIGTKIDGKYTSDYSNAFIKKSFKPFHGTITLQND